MAKRILALLLLLTVTISFLVSCSSLEEQETIADETNANTTNNDYSDENDILTPLDNDFLSRTETKYENINGKTVTLYGFFVHIGETENNPNFSQAVLIDQCIDYKDAHPDEDVYITLTSFHLSVYVAACLDKSSPEYGKMKNLYDEDFTSDGYYRLSYLLVEAARKGIEVTVIGHINAADVTDENGEYRADGNFDEYFNSHLDDEAYIEGKSVSDYMTFRKVQWLSYGDKSASDMMHNKTLSVSNYIDSDGNEHGATIWTGSINVDGVHSSGINGHNSIQSAVIISEHEELRRVMYNYTRLMAEYCDQEQSILFRNLIREMNTEQIALLSQGKGAEIPSDKQVVYLGTENDPVFELYFTSFGGTQNSWDTLNNPYCKYISKLSPSVSGSSYIEFYWNNVKYKQDFNLADTIMKFIARSFEKNGSTGNVLSLNLPGIDEGLFSGLTEGTNIGRLALNERNIGYHIKDLQLSYEENGVRHYVTIYNSLNIHEGSMAYQTNTVLVVNETAATGNNNYVNYGYMTLPSMGFENKRLKDQ